MIKQLKNKKPDWIELIAKIRNQFVHLADIEKEWLRDRLAVIEKIQTQLDQLFCKAGGETACADCDGECCGCGRHHITLTNLLAYLVEDETPPAPDFSKTCPYLGESGCLLQVASRPYNCITFFCEQLEDGLSVVDREALRELDRQLRIEYEAVAVRYPVASLRGLWIALEQHGEKQILR